jgi:hypothetical protein
MSRDEQDTLLGAVTNALEPGGVMLIREADAAAGWRFTAVRIGNRLKAWFAGGRGQRFSFRTADEWIACCERLGFAAVVRPMGQGTPFGNVLLRVTRKEDASAASCQPASAV